MISVILSGGSGTRLWPLSRNKLPKQFCHVFEQTLFEQTATRLGEIGEVMVCTGGNLMALTEKAIKDKSLKVEKVFYEPFGRNTAPAVALICRYLQMQGRDNEVVGIFPSDHWIEKKQNFIEVLQLAERCAQEGQIVTIGIEPSYPATGFGYIECTDQVFLIEQNLAGYSVKGFHEKPDLKTATEYLSSGKFHWNSGMFVFSVSTMIEAFKKHMPEMWNHMEMLEADLGNLEEVYKSVPADSLDYGIMEKAENQVCIPCDIGWSDLGSWDDIEKCSDKIEGHFNKAQTYELEAHSNFAFSNSEKVICVLGVDDLNIINTDDVLLITKKGESQKVKKLLEEVKKKQPELGEDHKFEYRPWGMYRNLWEESLFKSKVIEVDAGQQLSYQSHDQREETWVIVQGQGEVVLNDQTISVAPGEVIKIPKKAKHRMRNTGAGPLKFVEVQMGEYFGEDDIVRYQDDYNRV